MRRREIALAGATLMALVLRATAGRAEEATVNIDNFSFSPAELVVAAGTKVTWLNRDDIPHTVTDAADPRAFKSAALDTGDAFSFVFPAPGTYRYFCSLHPHMQATVVVR